MHFIEYIGRAVKAVDELFLPNGVNVSPDKKYLYLYSVGDLGFRVYAIQQDGSLHLKQINIVQYI